MNWYIYVLKEFKKRSVIKQKSAEGHERSKSSLFFLTWSILCIAPPSLSHLASSSQNMKIFTNFWRFKFNICSHFAIFSSCCVSPPTHRLLSSDVRWHQAQFHKTRMPSPMPPFSRVRVPRAWISHKVCRSSLLSTIEMQHRQTPRRSFSTCQSSNWELVQRCLVNTSSCRALWGRRAWFCDFSVRWKWLEVNSRKIDFKLTSVTPMMINNEPTM